MKKYLSFSVLVSIAFFSVILVHSARAQSSDSSDALSKLTYPIAELGNCRDKAACKTYCDDSSNTNACIDFADKKNLFSKDEVATAKKFVAVGSKGPGGCNG